MGMIKKLFLLDAYSLIFRAHYAFIHRPIVTSTGFDTSAVFGFVKSLQEVLKKEQPTHIAVVFDPPGGSFRRRLYTDYKATRLETPESIITAVPIIKAILEAYKIAIVEIADYEADDVIGTMAKQAEKEGYAVYMMTPDKDYGQLVSYNVFMYKPKRSGNEIEIIGQDAICEQYGIQRPEQVIDILALWGDSVDNVPGAPGIGEKTAMKLIGEYGSVDGVYRNLDKLKGKQKDSLEENEEQVRLSRKLVTIVTDVPYEWNDEALELKEPDIERLRELFSEYEFFSMLRELSKKPVTQAEKAQEAFGQLSLFAVASSDEQQDEEQVRTHKTYEDVEHTYNILTTDEEIGSLIKQLESATEFCFDTETTGLDPFDCRLVGMSFALKPHEAWYIPVYPNNPEKTQALLNRFKSVFENGNIAKSGQNLKFDMEVLKSFGVEVRGALYDSMLIHYLLNPDVRHNMDHLAETYLNYSPISIETLIGKRGANQRTMDVVPLEKIGEYAAEDADISLQLRLKLFDFLEQENMQRLYTEIEAPLIGVLADIEAAGVRLDINSLRELNSIYTKELDALEIEVRNLAGAPELNISSPKQLGVVLFEKLKVAGSNVKKTKTKQYSTDEETLLSLRDRHPIIDKILEYRGLKKLLSAYIESLPALINRRTGKIHTSFNQAVTTTGRLSSNNPNLQNIPIRDLRGREIRKAFIPSDDEHILLSADYSQIELRLMAHLSQDPGMIEAFRQNEDIHAATAAKIYHIELSQVTKEQRSKAKTANFGIIYGISAFGLAQRLNISRTEAKQLIDGYFVSYPKVKNYMDLTIRETQKTGYAETIFGRRRYLRDINSGNSMIRGMAERNAINAPIQGTAADIIKVAMISINRIFKERNLKTTMILQVHDELVFDVYKPELDEVKQIVIDEMQNAAQLSVPLIVECGTGKNWLEAH
ncbi:MAG: DNA polymerase I [Prevotellaceae bacterium]|jgi:DNA polymerase-1|nr:DNA polymerase I [Prevotellaceae bacterium]